MSVFLFVLGLVLMVIGAELLVRGASRLAIMVGISPLVVGLTVVAFGTSAPEFAVSFKAAIADQADICVGNVVGSNIFNVLFILGAASLLTPLVVSRQLIRIDVPVAIAVSVGTLFLGWDGHFGRNDGIVLFTGLVIYTLAQVYFSKKERTAKTSDVDPLLDGSEVQPSAAHLFKDIGFIIVGLVLLVLGANWLVETAVSFARWLEVSELIIGLTIVAAGTSLPEVVTSIVASIKGERDIAVGNVVGSNIFNLLGVLGAASIVAPSGINVSTQALQFDIPVMIAVALLALPIFYTGRIISRAEGVVFLAYYVVYTVYLIMAANGHPNVDALGKVVVYGVGPLTIVVLGIQCIRWMSQETASPAESVV